MLEPALHTGVSPDASALSLADYLDQWLSHCRGRVRAKTHDGYRGLVRLYAAPALGHIRLRELRPLDLQGLYSQALVLTRLGRRLDTEAPRLREGSPRAENHHRLPTGVSG
jgi:hypothetical protein